MAVENTLSSQTESSPVIMFLSRKTTYAFFSIFKTNLGIFELNQIEQPTVLGIIRSRIII